MLARVWRGGTGRRARIAALLGLNPQQRLKVALGTDAATRIGIAAGSCSHSDVVDVHVALLARQTGAAAVTFRPEGPMRPTQG